MTDRDWIVDRIGAPAFDQLATELAGSDLHSVLLEVMQRRAASRSPADVLAHYERDPFCAPAIVDLRESHAVDGHLLAAADGFEALGLSPVAPLGASSAMAHTGQNRVLSALRMMEVVSDSTNVLALECARRLRGRWDVPVHLATCHRVLRTQPQPRLPGHSQHFNLFALASGGREAKDHAFTVDTLVCTSARCCARSSGSNGTAILWHPSGRHPVRRPSGRLSAIELPDCSTSQRTGSSWSTPTTRLDCDIRSGSPHRMAARFR